MRMPDHRPVKLNPKPEPANIPSWAAADSVSGGTGPRPMPAVDGPEFLTVPEAASLLRVSEKTIRRQIACGRLLACRIGRSVRIPAKSLEMLPYSGVCQYRL